ncbi:MAG: FtsX-like permease family protein [bacterium]|nr:FtsX-like permease family protein [bacterium]
MIRWALKSLLSNKGSLLGSAAGIAGAFILVIFFDAVFRGESTQIVAYAENTSPDIWVMQKGVANMHMATSFLWDWKADNVEELEGVKRVTPISYLNTIIRAGEVEAFAFIVGLLPDADRAGPWEMGKGRKIEKSGEIVIPDVLAKLTGTGIGDKVMITDRAFTIVGLSKGAYSSANAIAFVPFDDLESILKSGGTYSFLLVDLEEGYDPRMMAAKIKNEVEKVNALTQEEFIRNDFAMAMQMGVEIIFMMSVICSTLAVLITGFTAYMQVVKKKREIAIIKAMGTGRASLMGGILMQSAMIAFTGFIMAAGFSFVIIPHIPALAPQLTLVVSFWAVAKMGLLAIVISIAGALIPAWNVTRLDPALVFNG